MPALLYPYYVLCGVAILYSLMIALGSDQHLAGPQPEPLRLLVLHHELFALPDGDLPSGPLGDPLRRIFTFIIPVLVVVNVPARSGPAVPGAEQLLAVFTLAATAAAWSARAGCLTALESYRSASS